MVVMKIFVSLVVIVAVVVGIMNLTPFHPDAVRLAMFSEFFSAALPILAFGALVRYLCCCSKRSCCCCCGSNGKECRTK